MLCWGRGGGDTGKWGAGLRCAGLRGETSLGGDVGDTGVSGGRLCCAGLGWGRGEKLGGGGEDTGVSGGGVGLGWGRGEKLAEGGGGDTGWGCAV